MKTIRLFLFAALAALPFSCTREESPSEYEESVDASLSGSRFAITSSGKSVWNIGDLISVFVDGGENEAWTYSGTNAASSGTFKHVSQYYRFSRDRMNAIFPYDGSYGLASGRVAVELPSSSPLLAAACDGAGTLNFHYLTSVVRLKLDRKETVKSFVFHSFGAQKPGGSFSVDFNAAAPALVQESAIDSLVLPGGDSDLFYINVPPANYSAGFYIDIEYSTGLKQTVRHTPAVDFKAGEVLDVQVVSDNYTLVLTVDFRSGNPFSESFPSSKPNGRTDRTFTLVQDGVSYKFTFHPGYYMYPPGHEKAGQLEYGYARAKNTYFSPAQYGMTIGRDSSYIKLPAVPGKRLLRFEFLAGNQGNSVCLAKDSLGVERYDKPLTDSSVGELRNLSVNYLNREDGRSFYLYQTGGNFLLLWFKLYYQ